MSKVFIFISLIIVCISLCGCGASIDSDAKEAAEMMQKSLDLSIKYELEEADEYFQRYKEIEKKYINTDKHKEFTEAYWKYFTNNSIKPKQKAG